jgi:hypothetical protein
VPTVIAVATESRATVVLKDRRTVPRRAISRVAKFHNGVGSLPRDCMITDISERGARLYSEAEMPEAFTLLMSGEGENLRRECRVVWRLGGEIGVEFTDRRSR